MTADARMLAVKKDGEAGRVLRLPRAWPAVMENLGIAMRMVDVGEHVLVEVATLSTVEARRVNDAYRRGHPSDEHTARAVDELIGWVGPAEYYSPWIIVERVDID